MFGEIVEDCAAGVADWTEVVGLSTRAEGEDAVELGSSVLDKITRVELIPLRIAAG